MKDVFVKVDGISVNATHYTRWKKEDAVKAMEADGVFKTHGKNADWAGKVYDELVKGVDAAKKKEEADAEAKKSKSKKLGIVTTSAPEKEEKLPPGTTPATNPGAAGVV